MNDLETRINSSDVSSGLNRLCPATRGTTSTRSSAERRVPIQIKWFCFVSGLLAAAVTLSACKDATAVADVRPADVDVAPVLVQRIRYWDEFNGRISAIGSVEIRPRVTGYVDRINYREGDEVRRGELLFSIDPRPYQAAVNSATA